MPYDGYTYDFWGQSIPSRAGYTPDAVYYAEDMGLPKPITGEDLFVYDGLLYMLDSGAGAVVALDESFKTIRIIDKFTYSDGSGYTLNGPTGLFIRDDTIYIADKGNGRVIKCGFNGVIQRVYERPVTELLEDTAEFKPSKVVVDDVGNCYVVCEGLYQGMVNYDKDGKFVGFYGGNQVQLTFSTLAVMFWKRVLSREQARNMIRFVPVEYSNAFLLGDFVYTVTKSNTNSVDEIQKLNPIGKNVLHFDADSANYAKNNFGDVETAYYKQTLYDSQLVDIHVDEDGIITALDFERGRLFQYDQECNIVAVFGSRGRQKGNFLKPVAVEKYNGSYVVLDKEKRCITTFTETEYMGYVREGIRYYQQGLYEESMEPWRKVLDLNSNYQLAYLSIGRALYQQKDYAAALEYFKLAQSRKDYSLAFRAYRTEVVRKYFALIIIGFVAGIYLFVRFVRFAKKKLGVEQKKVRLVFK